MPDSPWQLHPNLASDCHTLGRLTCAHLLLHRNAAMHWFILVPETAALDLLDLPRDQRDALLEDAGRVNAFLKATLSYPRVNVGALGLLVPQLHLHVVGRREGDACWPAPVWGNLTAGEEYTDEQLQQLRRALEGLLH